MVEGFGSDVYIGVLVGIISFFCIFKLLSWIFGNNNRNILEINELNEVEDAARPPIYNPNCCPICLGVQSLALETNCGHLYCGPCLRMHYLVTSRGDSSGFLCAMCRQRVVLIFICFSQEERQGPVDRNTHQARDEVLSFVTMYNRIVRNDLTLMEHILELPVLLRHLIEDTFQGEGLVNSYFRFRIILFTVLTIIYVLIPFDLIPELVFGVYGYIEDILVLVIVFTYILMIYRNYIAGG